jgi:hypothetical protein
VGRHLLSGDGPGSFHIPHAANAVKGHPLIDEQNGRVSRRPVLGDSALPFSATLLTSESINALTHSTAAHAYARHRAQHSARVVQVLREKQMMGFHPSVRVPGMPRILHSPHITLPHRFTRWCGAWCGTPHLVLSFDQGIAIRHDSMRFHATSNLPHQRSHRYHAHRSRKGGSAGMFVAVLMNVEEEVPICCLLTK